MTDLSTTVCLKLNENRNEFEHGFESFSTVEIAVSFDQLIGMISTLAVHEEILLFGASGTRKISAKGMLIERLNEADLIAWLEGNTIRLNLSKNAVDKIAARNGHLFTGVHL